MCCFCSGLAMISVLFSWFGYCKCFVDDDIWPRHCKCWKSPVCGDPLRSSLCFQQRHICSSGRCCYVSAWIYDSFNTRWQIKVFRILGALRARMFAHWNYQCWVLSNSNIGQQLHELCTCDFVCLDQALPLFLKVCLHGTWAAAP